MRPVRLVAVLLGLFVLGPSVTACSVSGEQQVSRPIEHRFRTFVLRVPARPEITEAFAEDGSDFAVVRLCSLEPDMQVAADTCGHPLIDPVVGLRVIIHDVPANWGGVADPGFRFLRERPMNANPPLNDPLVPVDALNEVARRSGMFKVEGYEGYALARIPMPNRQIYLTTAHDWPIASCSHEQGRGGACKFGFLINGAFVEVTNSIPYGRTVPNQAELWRLATELDAKLRNWMTPATA